MPRRQASQSVVASDEAQQRPDPLAKILNDHDFADAFHGETSTKFGRRMASAPHGDADGDADMVGDDGRNGYATAANGNANGAPAGARMLRRGSFDFENAPVDLNELITRQLKEDREGLRYDIEWTRHQVGLTNLTPAEHRTYQLRLLDLGHQLRQTNHRIHMREAEMHNSYRFGLGPASYPPQMYAPMPSQNVSFMNAEPPQERRGPGRPLGSKNRSRDSMGPASVPSSQPPPNSAQKAAALASAGAKRILPTEITVATPNGNADESGPLVKRPRIEVGSPLGSPAAEDRSMTVDVGAGDAAHSGDTTNEDTTVENSRAVGETSNINMSTASVLAAPTPSTPIPSISANTSILAGGSATPVAIGSTPGGTADETGPGGSAYQRLGHWMCTLCTSQKYLQHPAPKQPSEPSSWPLRDVSKIVTHYTRMHGEHNRMERCMELGTALQANLGPFRYWIQETKREKIPLEDVREALAMLQRGSLPDLLRRFSTAARAFPN
ncbi:hypothetical protein Daus18300_005074 [Diaporthe australafricana]|uniref:Uncharacterized protein n=1 Tax=Diaporthe australafricana TaxID=127596 RepID=A0ABR3X568_9PEZI